MKNREQVHARAQARVRDAFAEALKYGDYLADRRKVAEIHAQLVEITQPVLPEVKAIADGHAEGR